MNRAGFRDLGFIQRHFKGRSLRDRLETQCHLVGNPLRLILFACFDRDLGQHATRIAIAVADRDVAKGSACAQGRLRNKGGMPVLLPANLGAVLFAEETADLTRSISDLHHAAGYRKKDE